MKHWLIVIFLVSTSSHSFSQHKCCKDSLEQLKLSSESQTSDVSRSADINWQAITTLITSVTLIITIIKLILDTQAARRAHNASTIVKMLDEFHSERIKNARYRAAKAFDDKKDSKQSEDLLDFFESIAMLVKRDALDEMMVWSMFGYWMKRYWHACKTHIQTKQQADPTLWEDFTDLIIRFEKLDKKKHGDNPPRDSSSEEELTRFVKEEIGQTANNNGNKHASHTPPPESGVHGAGGA
jgi:hypothetical protein